MIAEWNNHTGRYYAVEDVVLSCVYALAGRRRALRLARQWNHPMWCDGGPDPQPIGLATEGSHRAEPIRLAGYMAGMLGTAAVFGAVVMVAMLVWMPPEQGRWWYMAAATVGLLVAVARATAFVMVALDRRTD